MDQLKKYYWSSLFGVLVLFGLWVASVYSYLLFHSIAEIFSIVVACGIFVLAWNSRRFLENTYLLFVGIAYLSVAGLDLVHTLAYKGMGVFQGYEANLSTQLWISGRYVESISLLLAAFLMGRKLKAKLVLVGYGVITTLILTSIFYWNIFPVCYVEGTGLTAFKKVSEYLICFLLLTSIVMLTGKHHKFEPHILRLLIASITVTIASELAFTFYVDVTGFSNLVGHYLKIISFYLVYKAIIETGLKKPFALLLRDLKQSEEALKAAKEHLEIQVDERTAELRQSIEKLQETELRYRTVADFTYDWIYWENPDGTLRYVSPSCERFTGYKVEEFMDNPKLLTEVVLVKDRDIWKRHHDDVLAEPKLGEAQFRIRTKDGQIRWIEHACRPVESGEGRFLGLRASNRDITERKRAEAELAKSREALRMLAGKLLSVQEEERRRLAREMHDDLTQRLALLSIEAGKLEQQLESSPVPLRDKLRQMKEQMVKLSADVHDISRQLHPAILDDLGLVDAIKSECASFSKREGISVRFEPINIPEVIPKDAALCIYRIMQESLRNIAKHAQVEEAEILLTGTDNGIQLCVKDHGVGFEPGDIQGKGGLGLASMEERVRLIQGQFSIQSQPGQGTTIELRAPLSRRTK